MQLIVQMNTLMKNQIAGFAVVASSLPDALASDDEVDSDEDCGRFRDGSDFKLSRQ